MGSNHRSCGLCFNNFNLLFSRDFYKSRLEIQVLHHPRPSSAPIRTCTYMRMWHRGTRFCTEPAFSLCRASSRASLASKQAAWHLTEECVEDTTIMRNCEWTRSSLSIRIDSIKTTIRFQSCKNTKNISTLVSQASFLCLNVFLRPQRLLHWFTNRGFLKLVLCCTTSVSNNPLHCNTFPEKHQTSKHPTSVFVLQSATGKVLRIEWHATVALLQQLASALALRLALPAVSVSYGPPANCSWFTAFESLLQLFLSCCSGICANGKIATSGTI